MGPAHSLGKGSAIHRTAATVGISVRVLDYLSHAYTRTDLLKLFLNTFFTIIIDSISISASATERDLRATE